MRGSGMESREPSVHVNLLFAMSRDIGALQEGHRGMMALMERTRIEMHQRSDRLEQKLWQIERLSAHSPATTSPATVSRARDRIESLSLLLQNLAILLKVTLPLAFLAAVVAYKGAHPEWLPVLRKVLAAL